MMMRGLITALLVALTACRPPSPGTEEPPAKEQPVPGWQEVDPAWTEKATVILKGSLREYSYPCRFDEHGNSEMILARSWEVLEVLKGEVKAPDVNISAVFPEGAHVPEEFIEGRVYLLLLAPSETTMKLLADPETIWGLGNEPFTTEVVAIVDLSQSPEEAEALEVQASKSGTHDGFAFSAQKWKELRESPDNDLALQLQFLAFIMQVVLTNDATLASVRSWLGEPDWWWANEDIFFYRYALHQKTHTAPETGMISIRLEITFSSKMHLLSYRVENMICTKADETGDAWRDPTDEEMKQHGLSDVKKSLH